MRFYNYFLPRRYYTVLFLILMGLCGCVSVPQHDLANLSELNGLQTIVEEAQSDPLFTDGSWPSSQWWEFFQDPKLNHLIEVALANNPGLQQAQARIQQTIELAQKQRSTLLPTIDLDYQEQWEHFSQNGFIRSFYPTSPDDVVPSHVNQIDLSLNFSYEFDFWGKNKKKLQAALGAIQTASAEYAQTELIMTTYLAQTYFHLQSHLQQQVILQKIFDQRLDLYTLHTSRLENGIDPLFPMLTAETNIYFIEQLLIDIDKQIQTDKYLIQMLIGQGPDTIREITPSAHLSTPFPIPHHLSIDLVAKRPDLQAQIWRVTSAFKEIGVAKTEFYPNINLCALAGLESLSFSDLFNWSSRQGGIRPAIHLPIFTAGKLKANLRSKVAFYNEMIFAYNDHLLHAVNEVANQFVLLKAKNRELTMQKTAIDILEEQYELKILCFEKGIGTQLEVLQVEENLLNQSLLLIYLERDCLLANLQLIKALGGGYTHGQ